MLATVLVLCPRAWLLQRAFFHLPSVWELFWRRLFSLVFFIFFIFLHGVRVVHE